MFSFSAVIKSNPALAPNLQSGSVKENSISQALQSLGNSLATLNP